VRFESLPVPVLNYTPEEDTMLRTVLARWTQARRHALGVSDLTYFLTTLPLAVMANQMQRSFSVTGLMRAAALLFRLVNTHIVIALLTVYWPAAQVLRLAMDGYFTSYDRRFELLLAQTMMHTFVLVGFAMLSYVAVVAMYLRIYNIIGYRLEADTPNGPSSIWFCSRFLHGVYLLALSWSAGIYFSAIGLAEAQAAVRVLLSTSFEYNVASKPLPSQVAGKTRNERALGD